MNIQSLTQIPQTLILGCYDAGKVFNKKTYLHKHHRDMAQALQNKCQFKDEQSGKWRPFVPVQGRYIETLQTFLNQAGFMPNHQPDGIFGYETLAGVRLFQEYLRTFKGKSNMLPDGMAGKDTMSEVVEWHQKGNGVCDWAKGTPTSEYQKWMKFLTDWKTHFSANPNAILKLRENYTGNTDTQKIADWDVSSNVPHLIGIRRNQKNGYTSATDDHDFFVFLINGMAFYFFGSTVPNPRYANKAMAFLLEGQHKYRYGWHLVSKAKSVYKAWKPASKGVLVLRETAAQQSKNVINDATKMKALFDPHPNPSINIHWSGRGSYSFSGGCQVIGGASYVNNQQQVIDDGKFAAKNSGALHKHQGKFTGQKTKAAYDMLIDLFLNYTPNGVNTLTYSLVREETIQQLESWPGGEIASLETQMKKNIQFV